MVERDTGNRCERAVAAGNPQSVRVSGARDLGGPFAIVEHVHLDTEAPGLGGKLVGAQAAVARAWVDDQEASQWPEVWD